MTRRVLTLAEVLSEELEFIGPPSAVAQPRKPGKPRKPRDPRLDWRFTHSDLFEVVTLESRLSRSGRPPDRWGLLSSAVTNLPPMTGGPFASDWSKAYAQRVADALNGLVANPMLLADLLGRQDFVAILNENPRAIAAVLRNPTLREIYIGEATPDWQSDTRLALIVSRFGRLQVWLDDGSVIAQILRMDEIRRAVMRTPAILGALIDSAEIRTTLFEDGAARERLAEAYGAPLEGNPLQRWVASLQFSVTVQAHLLFGRAPARTADPAIGAIDATVLESILQTITGDPTAIHPDPPAAAPDTIQQTNTLLLEIAYADHIHEHRCERVIIDRLRRRRPTALCLSGGGIRSATFNLGILQGLARHGVLGRIDYLSTVSGGGYIGSWLSSWIRRHEEGASGAYRELSTATADPLTPDPLTVKHLREYSNYLAPRYGPFSPDIWTMVATYFRNLVLNWTLLLPPLIAALVLPRLYYLQLIGATSAPTRPTIVIAAVALGVAMALLAFIRPAGESESGKPPRALQRKWRNLLIGLFLVAGTFSAAAATVGWTRFTRFGRAPGSWIAVHADNVFLQTFWYLLVANMLAAAIHLGWHYRALEKADETDLNRFSYLKGIVRKLRFLLDSQFGGRKVCAELLGAAAAAAIGAALLGWGALTLFAHPKATPGALSGIDLLAVFGVPYILVVFFLEATVLLGVITKTSSEYEREWWARSSGMALIVGIMWILVTGASLVGPVLLTQLPKVLATLGGTSGLLAVVFGRSAKTTAMMEQGKRGMQRMLIAAAAVCLLIVIAALSLLLTHIVRPMLPAPRPAEGSAATSAPDVNAIVAAPAGYDVRVSAQVKKPDVLDPTPSTVRHIDVIRTPFAAEPLLYVLACAAALSLLASFLLNVNTYSMHGMYRNRLIRAYLGASRWFRRPDPFTGFDPQDNLQMYQLRPELLWTSSFKDFDGFAETLKSVENEPLYDQLPERVQEKIQEYVALLPMERDEQRADVCPIVFGAINDLMIRRDLATGRYATTDVSLVRRNREYLQKRYGCFLDEVPEARRPPLHIINAALNLVAGGNLAWQERKAESFTVSPLHAGCGATTELGYRDSATYGGRRGISLGTAMAISGAAVSPNMGYNSSSLVTFLMTLFNARLGWWLGNPGPHGETSYRYQGPFLALWPLLSEALGNTTDRSKYVFLSDGGHFDNLGIYEMVRRRCRTIIACDATGDEKYAFNDLANAVRKIRIDLGVPIDIESLSIGPDPDPPATPNTPATPSPVRAYCAIGRIRYGCVDGIEKSPSGARAMDGRLLYIKPVVHLDVPVDVRNYKIRGEPFPQEPTLDQFFSETQFESYRALAAHMIQRICGHDRREEDLEPHLFVARAEKHLKK